MKELSIEEKAKVYDEVVNKLRRFMRQGIDPLITSADVQDFFPELKESEGERIKNLIYCLIRDRSDNGKLLEHNGISVEEALDWVEKQGEKIDAIESFDTEFEKQVSRLIASAINKEYEYNQGYVKWTANALLNYAKHELEKQGEQKPTKWSEEDDKNLERTIWYVEKGGKRIFSKTDELVFWLKSIKDKVGCEVNCTTTKEWSEEDDKTID